MNVEDDRIQPLSPAATLVYVALREHGPQSRRRLVERTTLNKRTAQDALRKLEAVDVADHVTSTVDARQPVYYLRDHHEVPDWFNTRDDQDEENEEGVAGGDS